MLPLKDTNPTARAGWVTYLLIAANVAVYFFWQRGGVDLSTQQSFCHLVEWAAIPAELTDPGTTLGGQGCGPPAQGTTWLTPLSSMFMHGDLVHLGSNMLFLWIFGNNVEDRMGALRFLVFYLLAGTAALALQVAFDPGSEVPIVGASGAVAGVLGAYILLFPRARVWCLVLILILPLRAWLVLGYWFVLQALGGYLDVTETTEGGIAYFAHIGGFVFGLLAVRLFARRRRRPARLAR